MGFTKKEQYENKLKKVKFLIKNKSKLKLMKMAGNT